MTALLELTVIISLLFTPFFIVGLWRRRPVWAFILATLVIFVTLFGAGVIKTYQAMMIYGEADPQLMAGGISQSFVGTILRLIIYLPLLWLFQWFVRRRHRRKPPKVDADKTFS